MLQTVTRRFIYTFLASPLTPYNVGHVYMLFLQSFNIVFGGWGGGGEAMHFKTDNLLFKNTILKAPKINAITQVSQGILSPIVAITLGSSLYRLRFDKVIHCTVTQHLGSMSHLVDVTPSGYPLVPFICGTYL